MASALLQKKSTHELQNRTILRCSFLYQTLLSLLARVIFDTQSQEAQMLQMKENRAFWQSFYATQSFPISHSSPGSFSLLL